jgi:hypothetical protein
LFLVKQKNLKIYQTFSPCFLLSKNKNFFLTFLFFFLKILKQIFDLYGFFLYFYLRFFMVFIFSFSIFQKKIFTSKNPFFFLSHKKDSYFWS